MLEFNTPTADLNQSKRAKPKSLLERHIEMNLARSRSLQKSEMSKMHLQPIKRKLCDSEETSALSAAHKGISVSVNRYDPVFQRFFNGSANSRYPNDIPMMSYESFYQGKNEDVDHTSYVSARNYDSLGFPMPWSDYNSRYDNDASVGVPHSNIPLQEYNTATKAFGTQQYQKPTEMFMYDEFNDPSMEENDSMEEKIKQEVYKWKHVYTGQVDTRWNIKALYHPCSYADDIGVLDGKSRIKGEKTEGVHNDYGRTFDDDLSKPSTASV